MLRNGAEFCILRGLLYDGTVSEQKAENAQKPCNFVKIARLLNCFGGRSKTSALQSYEEVIFYSLMLVRGSAHFIDRLKRSLHSAFSFICCQQNLFFIN